MVRCSHLLNRKKPISNNIKVSPVNWSIANWWERYGDHQFDQLTIMIIDYTVQTVQYIAA